MKKKQNEESLHIKWPWEMIWIEHADEIIAQIREALPPDHEIQKHKIVPIIKWNRRPIFIVDDDTTGERILMNFEKMKRWKKTKFKIPIMKVFKNDAEIAELIEHNHQTECVKYNDDETLK